MPQALQGFVHTVDQSPSEDDRPFETEPTLGVCIRTRGEKTFRNHRAPKLKTLRCDVGWLGCNSFDS